MIGRLAPPWDRLLLDARLATLRDDLGAYGAIDDGALAWKDGLVTYAGPRSELPGEPAQLAARVDSANRRWITPGLVDCHTHLVFAGDRAQEFERRLQGASYEQIAREGGGILSTVRATRAASEDDAAGRVAAARPRAARRRRHHGRNQVRLRPRPRRRAPHAARGARHRPRRSASTVRTTFLAAHALPPEFAGRADDYITAACEWLAVLHAEGLVDAVDAFCEGIGFSPAQTRRMFDAARALGLPVKLHADQLSDLGGAALAAEFGGLSADHVEHTSEASVQAMARAGTVAVLLPGAFHVLRETRLPPLDLFRRHAVPMAVATDLNPGTSPLQSLRLAMALACTHFRLTPEEALRGATVHAAARTGPARPRPAGAGAARRLRAVGHRPPGRTLLLARGRPGAFGGDRRPPRLRLTGRADAGNDEAPPGRGFVAAAPRRCGITWRRRLSWPEPSWRPSWRRHRGLHRGGDDAGRLLAGLRTHVAVAAGETLALGGFLVAPTHGDSLTVMCGEARSLPSRAFPTKTAGPGVQCEWPQDSRRLTRWASAISTPPMVIATAWGTTEACSGG